MKTKSLIALCIILFVSNFVVANGFMGELREQDALIEQQAELIALQEEYIHIDTITMSEDFTLIRSGDDYIYLTELTISRELWEAATKQIDINGITWYEIMQDGYIKVYAEGHIVPDQVHWYAAY
jgi:hypothetical protein